MTHAGFAERDVTLLDLLDRALDKGVVLRGDLTLAVADVDLVYVGLQVLLSSVETAERMRRTGRIPDDPGPAERESPVAGP
ncbi:MAG: gas vesicle protein [Chloroflexi bacterium]|nr:gas vesicle protein [Chloroflexota bacterium]MBI2982749.1 gas vesicle protein [Chloroflexota bacterium]